MPLFGAGALSSLAYAPDEIILTLLIAGQGALIYSPLVGLLIALVLLIVVGTYRYNLRQLDSQGGDFHLVKKELGPLPALLLAASLILDACLTVAISLTAASHYLTTFFPSLAGHSQLLACLLIGLFTLLCLLGMRGLIKLAFLPAYLFTGLLLMMIISGYYQDASGQLGLAPSASYQVADLYQTHHLLTEAGMLLVLLRAFSSGSVTLSGINTAGNALKALPPASRPKAARALMITGGIAALSLTSLLYLANRTQLVYTLSPDLLLIEGHPAPAGFQQQPVLLQLAQSIFGNHWLTTLLALATVGVLGNAAMTSFMAFPLLATQLASRQYLPIHLASKKRRLYRNGVLALGGGALALVALMGPSLHTLAQIYLVGAFLALSITQLALIKQIRQKQRLTLAPAKSRALWRDLLVTATGSSASLAVLGMVTITKFTQGAWLALLLILLLSYFMMNTKKHYQRIDQQLGSKASLQELKEAKVLPSRVHALIYVERVRKPALRAIAYARAAHPSSIEAVMVQPDRRLRQENLDTWQQLDLPLELTILDSSRQDPAASVMDYIQQLKQKSPRDLLVIYLPEYLVPGWRSFLFHRRTVHKLKTRLRQEEGVVVASVPWKLGA